MTYIIRAGETEERQQLGGKAAALSALHMTGLPIPPWFVVSPTAFTTSLSKTQCDAFKDACARSDSAAVEAILATVQLNAEVSEELVQAVASLCPHGEHVAVRSSALEEDSTVHSFAGQFETFLFVPPQDVAAKVIAVWRSGFSGRVFAYRREHGLGVVVDPPVVLVQSMINAEIAGVAFSADPVTGRRSVAIVSALYGLGTALVSGENDADTYAVDRSGAILSRTVVEKKTAYRHLSDEGEGVQVMPVPLEIVTQPALKDAQICAVAHLARCCERHFGCPQDIEWAIAGDMLFLLQSRSVTSLAQMVDPDGQYALWDNSNIAESYNGVTTPLTFSFARFAYEHVYRQLCRVLGVSEATILRYDDTFRRMIGLINGCVYYNLLSWYRLLALMPGFTANRKFMEQMMGVKEGLPESIVTGLGRSTWGGRMKDRLRLLGVVGKLLASYVHLPQDIHRFFWRIDQALGSGTIELEQMRADELVDAYRSLERKLITHWDVPLVNDLFTMIFYGVLHTLVVKWCRDDKGSLQNDLLTGEAGTISIEPAQRVRKLAAIAASHPALVESLCSGSSSEAMLAMAAVPEFATEYQSYLERFADRCLEELKLESATLLDDPLPLLRSVGNLARRLQASYMASTMSSQTLSPKGSVPIYRVGDRHGTNETTPRSLAEQRVATVLRHHPIRRLLFTWVLKQARGRVGDRENLRFERTLVFGRVRRIFSELGRRFYALGLLKEPRDIFYLEVEEVLGFVTGTATTTDLKGLVSIRKAEYTRYKTLEAPADRFETCGIVNHGNTFRPLTHSERSAGEVHKGIGCCPGIVRGPVRIITDPKDVELRAGEILVTKRTDPGWIMLFPAAAGILVERGSLLSHSAIVAREMSIPTIVALSDATRWLQDGDWVELDGSSGLVSKIDVPAKEVIYG
jgi:pyruvate,water dikinase